MRLRRETRSGRTLTVEVFEIVVKGTLSPALVGAIDGFTVTRVENGQTHLVGEVPDQARLVGLLAQMRDLTIELVSVNALHGTELLGDPLDNPTEGTEIA